MVVPVPADQYSAPVYASDTVFLAIVKARATGVAALTFVLPPCVAVIVQVPGLTMCTVPELTVQMLVSLDANVTARAELLVAATPKSGSPYVLSASGPKVIVWPSWPTVNERTTSVAGPMFPFPACEAVMVHVPAETMWTVEPDTVQMPVVEEANVTVNPESLVAETPKSASPKVLFGSDANVMV